MNCGKTFLATDIKALELMPQAVLSQFPGCLTSSSGMTWDLVDKVLEINNACHRKLSELNAPICSYQPARLILLSNVPTALRSRGSRRRTGAGRASRTSGRRCLRSSTLARKRLTWNTTSGWCVAATFAFPGTVLM